ncbi:hypothetical protein MTO96_036654, partial [Rhipicephalus appendiculatus]
QRRSSSTALLSSSIALPHELARAPASREERELLLGSHAQLFGRSFFVLCNAARRQPKKRGSPGTASVTAIAAIVPGLDPYQGDTVTWFKVTLLPVLAVWRIFHGPGRDPAALQRSRLSEWPVRRDPAALPEGARPSQWQRSENLWLDMAHWRVSHGSEAMSYPATSGLMAPNHGGKLSDRIWSR